MPSNIQSLYEKTLRFLPQDGLTPMPVPGVHCSKISEVGPKEKRLWQRRLAIVLGGEKEISLGLKTHHCTAGLLSFTPIDLPVISRIAQGSKKKPFVAILFDLDSVVLAEVVKQIETKESSSMKPSGAIFIQEASTEIIGSLERLIHTFNDTESSRFLGPMIVKEILFYTLKGSAGEPLRQFIRSGNKTYQVAQAIHKIQTELAHELNVEELAAVSNMSRAVFFKCFKDVTSMSPIQFQKRLRLLEAQRLLQTGEESAESSAYKVGYNSASQFSREYSRMFGQSPIRSVKSQKRSARNTS